MKTSLRMLALGLFVAATMTGCAMVTPMNGSLYTDLSGPVAVGNAGSATKRGEATATAIIGIALGDASLETAMRNGNITKVHHVDSKVRNILGIYAEYTTIVFGE